MPKFAVAKYRDALADDDEIGFAEIGTVCDIEFQRATMLFPNDIQFATPQNGLATSCNECALYSATSSPVSSPSSSTG